MQIQRTFVVDKSVKRLNDLLKRRYCRLELNFSLARSSVHLERAVLSSHFASFACTFLQATAHAICHPASRIPNASLVK